MVSVHSSAPQIRVVQEGEGGEPMASGLGVNLATGSGGILSSTDPILTCNHPTRTAACNKMEA